MLDQPSKNESNINESEWDAETSSTPKVQADNSTLLYVGCLVITVFPPVVKSPRWVKLKRCTPKFKHKSSI